MRLRASILILLAAPTAFGQINRTFHLDNPPPAPYFQEIETILRSVARIKTVAVDALSASISVSCSAADIPMAEWIVRAFDLPSSPIQDLAIHQYLDLRVFYLSNYIYSPQGIQELLTLLRTLGDIQLLSQYTPLHALAVRGTKDQVALAAWLIDEFDQPPSVRAEGIHQFHSSDGKFPLVQAFYLVHRTPKDVQDTLTALRKTTHIQRAFLNTARAAVIISGTPAQVDEASHLVAASDRGAP